MNIAYKDSVLTPRHIFHQYLLENGKSFFCEYFQFLSCKAASLRRTNQRAELSNELTECSSHWEEVAIPSNLSPTFSSLWELGRPGGTGPSFYTFHIGSLLYSSGDYCIYIGILIVHLYASAT